MASWKSARIAGSLPEVVEGTSRGTCQWKVKEKLFVWERPLRKADLTHLADAAPAGEILGARVEHELAKQVLIEHRPDLYFTTPHFNGYPAILVKLDQITVDELEETIVEAWLNRAPKRLVEPYLTERSRVSGS